MKKFFAVILACCFVFLLTGCNIPAAGNQTPPDPNENQGSVVNPTPSDSDEKLEEVTSPTLSEKEVERIHDVYVQMADRYNIEAVKKVENKEIDASSVFEKEKKQRAVAPLSLTREAPKNTSDIWLKEQEDLIKEFNRLKNVLEEDFSKYCKKYHPLRFDDTNGYARIQINEKLQELELSLSDGTSYYFFTGFYFDSDCNRHLDYEEGFIYSIALFRLDYSEVDGKIGYPVKATFHEYWEGEGLMSGGSTINEEADWQKYDITQAYTLLKYPFLKVLFSEEILPLIGANANAFPQQEDFRNKVDETFFNELIVGKFDLYGANFSSSPLEGKITDGALTFANNSYTITGNTRLFALNKLKLYISITTSTTTRTRVDELQFVYDETHETNTSYYLLSDAQTIGENGATFAINQTIDLSSPDCNGYNHSYTNYNMWHESEMPLEEKSVGAHVYYGYIDEKGNLVGMVSLPDVTLEK